MNNLLNLYRDRHLSLMVVLLAIGLLFLVGCGEEKAAGVSLLASGSGGSPVDELNASQESGQEPSPQAQLSIPVDDSVGLEMYEGLPVGFTAEGFPFMGNPEAAISLVEFSDYLCPFCGRHFNQTLPALIQQYGPGGDVNFVFRDFPLASLHPTAHIGHEGALCVGEQGAALYWQMHDELFRNQQQWANLPDPTAFVRSLAAGLDVDMDDYDGCVADGRYQEVVEQRVAVGKGLGFTGTPTFQVLVNETGASHQVTGAQPLNVFTEMLDTLIAGEELPEAEAAEPAELPLWASPEGLAPDPARPGYTLAGDPYKGNPEARVVVVEFADFQCPACQQHALEIQSTLDAALIDTGEVLWVFKTLPLKEHAQALAAAVAAECAGDQGRFWEMHHLLFERLDAWAGADVDAELLSLAEELELNTAVFAACYNGRAALERVVHDIFDAQGITGTTPAFVVLSDGRGTLLNGSRPADQFETLIRTRLGQENSDS